MTDVQYLQQIFIVSCGHFLQLGSVGTEASNGVSAKSRDEAKPIKGSKMLAIQENSHNISSPAIKFVQKTLIDKFQDAEQVHEQRPPRTQFDFVHEVNHKHGKHVETVFRETGGEGVLGKDQIGSCRQRQALPMSEQAIVVLECALRQRY